MSSIQKVQIVSDLSREKPVRAKKQKFDERFLERLDQFIDKLTPEDISKIALMPATAYLLNRYNLPPMPLGIVPNKEYPYLRWTWYLLISYLVIYKPDSIVNAMKGLGKLII